MANSAKRSRLWRCARVTMLVLVAAWVLLSPRVFPGLYSKRLFHPEQRGNMADLRAFNDVENREMRFTARNGSKLRGWIFINPGAEKVFLLHQGNAGDIPHYLDFVKLLLKTGSSVFIYEPRGFGESEGHPTVRNICEDGVSAFDFLLSLGYSQEQIVIYGVSLGASVASYVSTQRRSKGVILQSGFSSLADIARETVGILRVYPDFMFPDPKLDNAGIMEKPHAPLLILHGQVDDIIPISHSIEINSRAAAPTEFVVCPRSGHLAIDAQDEALFVGAISRFVSNLK